MAKTKRNDRGLTPLEQKFCIEFCKSGNETQSAIKAGYSESTAKGKAHGLLKKPHIKKEIDRINAKKEKKELKDIYECQLEMVEFMDRMKAEDDRKSYLDSWKLYVNSIGGLKTVSENYNKNETTINGNVSLTNSNMANLSEEELLDLIKISKEKQDSNKIKQVNNNE